MARCESVDLQLATVLCEQGDRVRFAYFPIGGFISLISHSEQSPRVEVGLVGREGMVGASVALGVSIAPLRAVVQGAGLTLRMTTAQFSRELERSATLATVVKRYLFVRMSQLARTAACTRFHRVEARLARWLLMTRDRARSDQFYLTHEAIANMLGVRRVGITRAAYALQEGKLVTYHRGHVTIINRNGLERRACSCYAEAKEIYARVMN